MGERGGGLAAFFEKGACLTKLSKSSPKPIGIRLAGLHSGYCCLSGVARLQISHELSFGLAAMLLL